MRRQPLALADFQATVWQHAHLYHRQLPWRRPETNGQYDPYKILVSEMMLQQTQVPRVIPKYEAFLRAFPNQSALATAPLSAVLRAWSGLGYNRRAKYLHLAAKNLLNQPQPWSYEALLGCPGIGPNTAAAILVYAYDQPLVFIETNVRSVFIHHFFKATLGTISDEQLRPLVAKALSGQQPRQWYGALMDYGVHLKATSGNSAARSRHYNRQSPFAGSKRQLRGQILRLLSVHAQTPHRFQMLLPDQRLMTVLTELQQEGLVTLRRGRYYLPDS